MSIEGVTTEECNVSECHIARCNTISPHLAYLVLYKDQPCNTKENTNAVDQEKSIEVVRQLPSCFCCTKSLKSIV
jgi:hypothetical protein